MDQRTIRIDDPGIGREHRATMSASKEVPRIFWETYSALANTDGGTIILVTEEAKDGHQASRPDDIVRTIRDGLDDRRRVNVDVLREDGIRVMGSDDGTAVVVEVPRARREDRPVYTDGNLCNTFRRRRDGNRKCGPDEIDSMVADSGQESIDERITDICLPCDVYRSTLASFRDALSSSRPGRDWCAMVGQDLLSTLGAAVSDNGEQTLTVAGLLMFGYEYHISLMFANYILDYREYDDDDEEWSYRLSSRDGDWSGNLYDFYTSVCSRLRNRFGTMDDEPGIGGPVLCGILEEAVLNAIIHADYNGRGGIRIDVRPDSVIVSNPGTFRIPIPEAIEGGMSDPRNKTLAKMFGLVRDAEMAGSGVHRMASYCRDLGLPAPTITESLDPTRVQVTISLERGSRRVDDLDGSILMMMTENPSVSIRQMAQETGAGKSRVQQAIASLKDRRIVRREGGTRGRWIVNNNRRNVR